MHVALDEIRDPAEPDRRVDAGADEALRASIGALGVLQPVLLAPDSNGYAIVAGRRRVAAARALGMVEIPAVLTTSLPVATPAVACTVAENMVRAAMHPLDQWRATVDMRESGLTVEHAATALGISDRAARRLEKLGRLHPGMLALIELNGIPSDRLLAGIANAPAAAQAKLVKQFGKSFPGWCRIAGALRVARIPRARAIFDVGTAGVVFEEDLFEEPDSEDAFFTTDVAGFLAAQRAALEASVAARQAKGERIEIADWSEKTGAVQRPQGWEEDWGWTSGKPVSRGSKRMRFIAVATSGYRLGEIRDVVALPRSAKKTESRPGRSGASQPTPRVRGPITQAGLELIARAKTTALRNRLRSLAAEPPPAARMLPLLCLAFAARNIDAHGLDLPEDRVFSKPFDDLAARFLSPTGELAGDAERAAPAVACELLARILSVGGPKSYRDSRDAAEWIGNAIEADRNFTVFDTPEVLATCSTDALREAAIAANLPTSGPASALRARIAGHAPSWRPAAANFSAPAPQPMTAAPRRMTADARA